MGEPGPEAPPATLQGLRSSSSASSSSPACGLVYELVAGTLASYLLGDSVTQFSTVIGVYLSAMGLGSYLSKFIHRGLARRFVDLELAVALVGGFSAPILFQAFAHTHAFRPVALRHGGGRRHPGGPGDPPPHAHPARTRCASRTWWPGADPRLHRRPGRLPALPAAPRAQAGPGAHQPALRPAERRGGPVVHLPAEASQLGPTSA